MYGNKYLNVHAIFCTQIDSTHIHIHYELLFRSKQLQCRWNTVKLFLTNLTTNCNKQAAADDGGGGGL
jgi:hypothetical protein